MPSFIEGIDCKALNNKISSILSYSWRAVVTRKILGYLMSLGMDIRVAFTLHNHAPLGWMVFNGLLIKLNPFKFCISWFNSCTHSSLSNSRTRRLFFLLHHQDMLYAWNNIIYVTWVWIMLPCRFLINRTAYCTVYLFSTLAICLNILISYYKVHALYVPNY